jgi:hypothetical protein
MYENVQQMVSQRLHDHCGLAPVCQSQVTVRLPSEFVEYLDMLVGYLGYGSRQQLMSDLMTAAIETALDETMTTLSEVDLASAEDFKRDRLEIYCRSQDEL